MVDKIVNWPEGADWLWRATVGRNGLERIRLAIWWHDLQYKNQGVLEEHHWWMNPRNGITTSAKPGRLTRLQVDQQHRKNLIERGAPKWAAGMIYRLNRAGGQAIWDDTGLVGDPDPPRDDERGR